MEGLTQLMADARQKLEGITKQNDEVIVLGTSFIKKSQIQAVQAMEEATNCTYVFLIGGARLMVKDNVNNVLKLLKWA